MNQRLSSSRSGERTVPSFGGPTKRTTVLIVLSAVAATTAIGITVRENVRLRALLHADSKTAPAEGRAVPIAPGQRLPNFGMTSLTLEAAHLLTEIEGETGIVVFLTVSCPYCQQALPDWEALATEAAASGLSFRGVVVGPSGSANRYAQDNAIRWPVWTLDPTDEPWRLGVTVVPLTIFHDGAGVVVQAWAGTLNEQHLAEIRSLTAKHLQLQGGGI